MHRIICFGKCFADPIAIRVLRVLLKRPMTIQDLQNVMLLDRHTVDLRLNKLRDAFLIESEYHGRWLRFRIGDRARPVIERVLGDFFDEIDWDPQAKADDKRFSDYEAQGTETAETGE